MDEKYLGFDIATGRQKPENIINTAADCPFCNRASLTDIIDSDGELLLIKNKYHVLADAYQTVLIETTDCQTEFSNYDIPKARRVIRFGIRHWLAMMDSGKYSSVIFFKNHGALSGGTIRHPHMQIVGFYELDCFSGIEEKDFYGCPIAKQGDVELSIAAYPRIGFTEFAVRLDNHAQTANIDTAADFLKIAAHFTLNHQPNCHSYNIFFYLIDGRIRIKLVPRYATSPLYIGYHIRLIPNNIEQVADFIKKQYFLNP